MVYCLFIVSISFLAHENVGFASKLGLLAEILTIFDFCAAIFNFANNKFCSMMTGCHKSDL